MKTNFIIPAVLASLFVAGCGNKMFKEAEQHYSNSEFSAAARIYENYIRTDSNRVAMLHLADCYRQMNRNSEAEKWYSLAMNSSSATPDDQLHYAEVLKENGKYSAAQSVYKTYLAKHPENTAAQNQYKSCDTTQGLLARDPFYEVEELALGINGSCFSPAKMGDNLLITAEAPEKTGTPVNSWTGKGYLDLYVVSEKKEEPVYLSGKTNGTDGLFSKDLVVTPLAGTVNSKLHEGPAVILPGGSVMYFTRSNVKVDGKTGRAKDKDNHLELCSAELVNGEWVNVKSFSFNSLEYSCGHPAVSSDGNRLYFISDKPGGYGGTDIYYCERENGNWGAPVNAGSKVNTSGNEMFPVVRSVVPGKDELYYSSDGLAGAGGLDIFRCTLDGAVAGSPVRMSSPFNSSGDDFGILFLDGGKEGYFSSNRGSDGGVDKIYSFRRKDPSFFVNLTVQDKESKVPVPEAVVEVFNSHDHNTIKMTTDETGHLIFPADSMTNYGFTLRCSSYFCGFSAVNTGGFKGKLNDTTYFAIDMEKIVINKPIRLENIYYDYNKWNIRPEAAVELDKLVKVMADNPQIKIELSSHTDSRGGDNFNMKLSVKRAQSAVDYIVSKGISRDRITAKGYGESVPLNKCTNGVKCTEEEFQWNRRTEFKVTKILE